MCQSTASQAFQFTPNRDDSDQDAFGSALRERRDALDLSRGDVARAAGLDRTQVFAIERGRMSPTIDQGRALAAAVLTDLAELLHEARALATLLEAPASDDPSTGWAVHCAWLPLNGQPEDVRQAVPADGKDGKDGKDGNDGNLDRSVGRLPTRYPASRARCGGTTRALETR